MRLKTFNFCMSYTFKIILIFKLFHNPILDYVKLMLTFLTLKNWIKKDAKKEVINELPIRFMTCDSTQNLTITFFFFKDLGYFLSTPKSKKSLIWKKISSVKDTFCTRNPTKTYLFFVQFIALALHDKNKAKGWEPPML